ncbi:MAG TPA: metallophosphoesterase family protein [Ignavibacteriales bacterium]|nr:metallophosphoesterase family protein [Ignavibacteriales bacterium]
MKTLVLSDIHGNLPALEAILEKESGFDTCLFLGDVVDYGPFPKECIQFLMDNMDFGVMGNHDNAIANNVDCGCRGDFRKFSVETRQWHKALLGKEELGFLRHLPTIQKTGVDGRSVFMAHATPQGGLTRYINENELEDEIKGVSDEIILLGHTHIQFMRYVGTTLVVNPGSVGLARDGGSACYATITDGQIKLHRLPYDVERTVKALMDSPVSEESKQGLTNVLYGRTLS